VKIGDFDGIAFKRERIPSTLAPFICARYLYLYSKLSEDEREDIINFITGMTNMLETVEIFGEGDIGEFCELLVKV
jgi:hypothetical protein